MWLKTSKISVAEPDISVRRTLIARLDLLPTLPIHTPHTPNTLCMMIWSEFQMCLALLASSRQGGLESSHLNFNSFQMLLFLQQPPMLTPIPDMASGFLYNQTSLRRYWRLLTTFYKRLKESSCDCKTKDRHIGSLCSKKKKNDSNKVCR